MPSASTFKFTGAIKKVVFDVNPHPSPKFEQAIVWANESLKEAFMDQIEKVLSEVALIKQ